MTHSGDRTYVSVSRRVIHLAIRSSRGDISDRRGGWPLACVSVQATAKRADLVVALGPAYLNLRWGNDWT